MTSLKDEILDSIEKHNWLFLHELALKVKRSQPETLAAVEVLIAENKLKIHAVGKGAES